ncbi:hypothetical protein [Helicobacter sp. T3_23-1059]
MKIFYIFLASAILSGFFSLANAACGTPRLTCTGANNTGHCIITGTGWLTLNQSMNADSLTIAQEPNADCSLLLSFPQGSNNTISNLIIARNGGTSNGAALILSLLRTVSGSLTITNVTSNLANPLGVRLDAGFNLINQDGTGGVSVTLPNGQTINKAGNPSMSGSNNGNTGGSVNIRPNATPAQIQNAAIEYPKALKEQLVRESTNTMILYNILNNYDGTYMSYDYGLSHQFSMGAFNNGGFFRYYNQNSNNGFDIGAKSKLRVANRFYLRSALYYSYVDFGKALATKFATHSIIAGIGLLKEFDFAIGGSGNVFFVLNPSVNAYYATTLKGKYIPTNHLVFGNIALDTGLKIKKTSLLLRGSAGGAFNSLKSINVNLGDNASYTNATFFNNQMYSASFVFKQGIGSKFYINADIGAVFVDKTLLDKSYLLKAGVLIGYELGKGFDNQNPATSSTRQSSRYQKLKTKNTRNTSKTNPRASSLNPTQKNATQQKNAKSKQSSKATNTQTKSPKVNLPKVKQTNPKSSAKSATKPNAKPTPTKKPALRESTKSTKAKKSKIV